MELPQLLCGDTKTVSAAWRKQVTRFVRGGPWLEAGTLIAARDAPGLIHSASAFHAPWLALGGRPAIAPR